MIPCCLAPCFEVRCRYTLATRGEFWNFSQIPFCHQGSAGAAPPPRGQRARLPGPLGALPAVLPTVHDFHRWLRTDSPASKCTSRGTLGHFSPTGFSPVFTLLQSRSALGTAPLESHDSTSTPPPRPPTREGLLGSLPLCSVSVPSLSPVHFRSTTDMSVSCYTLFE